jgi:endonuclease/exonuclease/phosphatase (EEP) superfamily protein YafD
MLVAAVLLTAFLALSTALPFLPLAHGIVRVGDFPRQQILVVALALLVATLVFGDDGTVWRVMQAALLVVVGVQTWYVLPFTPIWKTQTARFDAGRDKGEAIRLLTCNVKMSNDSHAALADEIRRNDPDIIVLMEIDDTWLAALREVLDGWPHRVEQPQDNSYGMVLASRLPLDHTSVSCLLTDGVPSIVTTMTTPEGRQFRLYSIHPEPPVPHRGTEGRDGETALVALKVRDETVPVIVTGDLNDVAWSRTTRRFRRISRLLDPRIGRKVFSTFDARYPLIRWPLDHLFHSPEFRLAGMHRLPACGSDHFPVLFDLVLCSEEKAESKPAHATNGDLERAKDLVGQARRRDDEPIGTDWES